MRHENLECKPFGGIEGTLYLNRNVYVKTDEARDKLADVAARLGYEIKDTENGLFATLKTESFAQCNECQGVMSRKSIGRVYCQCPHCNTVIMDGYPEDSLIKLRFNGVEGRGGHHLIFRIYEHDIEHGVLRLYSVPIVDSDEGMRISIFDIDNSEDAQYYLDEAEDKNLFTRKVVEVDTGQYVEVIEFPFDGKGRSDIVEVMEKQGIERFSMKRKHDNETFDSILGHPSLPGMFHIYETYVNGKRLSLAEPKAHEFILCMGNISNIVHDSRDSDFRNPMGHKKMTAYIEHFVDVDPEIWHEFLGQATLETPTFYYELAQWCADNSDGKERRVRHHLHEGFALPDDPLLVTPEDIRDNPESELGLS